VGKAAAVSAQTCGQINQRTAYCQPEIKCDENHVAPQAEVSFECVQKNLRVQPRLKLQKD
jgi:hypothetical protein